MSRRARHQGEVCAAYPNCVSKRLEDSKLCLDCNLSKREKAKSMEENSFNSMSTELDKLCSVMKNFDIWPHGENPTDKVLFKSFSGEWVHRDPLTQDRTRIDYDHALYIAKGIAMSYVKGAFDGKAYVDNNGEYILGEGTDKKAGRTPNLSYAIELAYNMHKAGE